MEETLTHDEEEILGQAVHDLLAGDWPVDALERVEAKLDKVLTNHLPHIEMRQSRFERGIARLEGAFASKERWQFCLGLVTIMMILYLAIK